MGNAIHGARRALAAGAIALAASLAVAPVHSQEIKSYWAAKQPPAIVIPGDASSGPSGPGGVASGPAPVGVAWEGISQYDNAALARNFIPPDTMGAVGRTQYVETSNGSYAVFDKATGARLSLVSDVAFWAAAGQTGANGDSRVMYNAAAGRWVVISFGANVADIQIAVSRTDNALGKWESVKFTGFAGGTADYPTLALDTNAVYIGTNNFKPGCSPSNPAANAFCGTTLNVIPLDSLFNAGVPTVANMKQFDTPYVPGSANNADRGFALQGVNSRTAGSTGTVIASSLFFADTIGYGVNNLAPGTAVSATLGPVKYLNENAYDSNSYAARQPAAAIPANRQIVSALDDRISSSVYEANGRIYMVHTVALTLGGDLRVRYIVIDKATGAILDQGEIGYAGYDFYQGSIAVNEFGDVVIGYNRSGLEQRDLNGDGFSDGNISFFVRTFHTDWAGRLLSASGETLLKVSLTDDYHNGSIYGQPAAGRQRWGDYSQVSVDPDNPYSFYLIGQFAREYNLPQFGHPGGTGGSRWGTWIAQVSIVPEPGTLALFAAALAVLGFAVRRPARTAPRA